MRIRTLMVILLAAALLVTTGLCGLTGYGAYQWARASRDRVRFFANENVSAEIRENHTYPAGGDLRLEVDTGIGDVTVSAYDGADVRVEIVKKAWAEDEAQARLEAEAIEVTVEQQSSRLKFDYTPVEAGDIVIGGSTRGNNVDFIIQVPADTEVVLRAGIGSLALTGTRGAASLRSGFGEVRVEDVEGPLTYTGASSTITLGNIRAGEGDITVESRFGGITANGLSGKAISLVSSNAALDIRDLEASGSVVIENQFGSTRVERLIAASLEVTNTSGEVEIHNSTLTGGLEVQASFTQVSIVGVEAAQYTVETSNGAIELDGARGRLELSNSFGEIRIQNARDAILALENNNGPVDFAGSLDEGSPHRVENRFGDITLRIPGDSAFNLSLETSFGEIETNLPVTLSGAMEDDAWQATLNGGGEELRAITNNGNIRLLALPGDDR